MARYCKQIMLLMVLLACIAALSGCRSLFRKERPQPKPPVIEIKEKTKPEAELSWDKRVAEAKEACSKEPDTIFGHAAYHEYDGQSFGIMIVGWKDSEYVVDLHHYDPAKKAWESAPTHMPSDGGYEEIDTAAVSKKWGISDKVIKAWLDDAESAAHKKFAAD